MTAWKYIGLIFGNTVGLWLSLFILVFPLLFFLKRHFTGDISPPPEIGGRAGKRIFIKSVRNERFVKSVPVLLFILFIVSSWFAQGGEREGKLYLPEPGAVAPVEGSVIIPLQTPVEDLRDGMIHKFSLTVGGKVVRLLLMKKPDGTLAVCLDACEICPPEGYGQGREHVVCIYCNTPIPFDSLGKPGGCNPIPLTALVTDKDVRITLAELVAKQSLINSGKGNEGGGR